MPTKRRSEAVPTGYAARHVGLNIADAGVRLAELSSTIIEDTLDGAPYDKAIRAAAEIGEMATHLSYTGWAQADSDYTGAERSSERLLPDDKR